MLAQRQLIRNTKAWQPWTMAVYLVTCRHFHLQVSYEPWSSVDEALIASITVHRPRMSSESLWQL